MPSVSHLWRQLRLSLVFFSSVFFPDFFLLAIVNLQHRSFFNCHVERGDKSRCKENDKFQRFLWVPAAALFHALFLACFMPFVCERFFSFARCTLHVALSHTHHSTSILCVCSGNRNGNTAKEKIAIYDTCL